MSLKVILKNFVSENEYLFSDWFRNDKEGMKFLSFYSEPKKWLGLIDGKNRFMFLAYLDEEPVGFFDFEAKEDKGHFAVYVKQERRGKGLARQILQEAFSLDIVNRVRMLDVGVAEDNKVSISLLNQFGFRQSGKDKDEMLVYLKNKPFTYD